MPRFQVDILVTKRIRLDRIFADDESEAEDKAEELVSGWNDVESAEAVRAEEI